MCALLTLPRTVTIDKAGKVVYGNVYTQLLEYIISADLVFYALMVAALIVLRGQAPNVHRSYRTCGYPIVPCIYIILSTLIILDLAILAPTTSGIGYLLVLTGIPVYLIWRRSAEPRHALEASAEEDDEAIDEHRVGANFAAAGRG